MHIEQFYDRGLAHASYAILHQHEIILVDPARDPAPYLTFAREKHAKIVGIIETHPHADFVSSHLEGHRLTGATIYCSKLVEAAYPHQPFDDGDLITFGNLSLKALNTPGHSPDSICVLLTDQEGKEIALFTGDTLFVGDVGRPDLREHVGNIQARASELAQAMFYSLRDKIKPLSPDTLVYPAHGPGSLCGKNMSADLHSTIGRELNENYALQEMEEEAFIQMLTADQPFIPKYFAHDVALNRQGAADLNNSIAHIIELAPEELPEDSLLIDTRAAEQYRAGHTPHAINIPDGNKFETWLGSIIEPGESFYLVGEQEATIRDLIKKIAKIGYEPYCKGFVLSNDGDRMSPILPLQAFKEHPEHYTIVDLRNEEEVKAVTLFKESIHIPLPRLREALPLIPEDKPIVVHCAGGYRSAIGASMIASNVPVPVYDLSTAIHEFYP